MKKFNDWPIQAKFATVVTAGALVGLSIGMASMALGLADVVRQGHDKEARAEIGTVRSLFESALPGGPPNVPPTDEDPLDGLVLDESSLLRVCSPGGVVLASHPAAPLAAECAPSSSSVSGVLGDVVVSQNVMAPDGSLLATIYLQKDLSTERSAWAAAVARGTAGTLAALVLVSFLASLVGSRVSQSVRQLSTLIGDAVQRSDYAARAEVTSRDELGVLAGTLNTLFVEVEGRYGNLVRSKGELESTVREQAADVSEANSLLIEARNKTEEVNRIKSAFLANVSHEFRTPLNGIVGMTHLLRDTALDEQQSEYVAGLVRSADSLRAVIDDMLDFSRLESGGADLERESLAIGEEIRAAVEPLLSRIHEKGLAFGLVISDGIPARVLGDRVRIRRVVSGLVSNAVKFTSDGRITVEVEGDRITPADLILHIAVRDSGVGIPKEKQQAIFEAFTHADASTTRMYGGTGLGLAICLRLVSLMGGRMWLESRPGAGTTFHLTIPVGVDESHERAKPDTVAGPRAGLRILVAEDNMVSRKLLTRLLEGKGHDVSVAGDGIAALKALGNQTFDLLLLDVQMPQMGGIEAARRIREDEAGRDTPRLPIIALTAQGTEEDRRRCHEAGFDAFLTKPVNTAELFEVVNAAATARGPASNTDSGNDPS
jgi:signal transduction histidine kinase/CheY-like chemotaxis protein